MQVYYPIYNFILNREATCRLHRKPQNEKTHVGLWPLVRFLQNRFLVSFHDGVASRPSFQDFLVLFLNISNTRHLRTTTSYLRIISVMYTHLCGMLTMYSVRHVVCLHVPPLPLYLLYIVSLSFVIILFFMWINILGNYGIYRLDV